MEYVPNSVSDRVGGPEWMRTAIGAAHSLEDDLSDPAQVAAITKALVRVATENGAVMVTGASALGHQLAGLVAASARPHLALWAQNGARGTVMVVEGVLVSGAQMANAARRARAAGAERIVGAAVIAEPAGLASCRRETGDLIVALRDLAGSR
jgi:uracil phosphoribosyltransferase